MAHANVGTLQTINAFRDDDSIYLVGAGFAPTSGWKHDFQKCFCQEPHADYVFISFPPTGMALQVITPFMAVEKIPVSEHPADHIWVLFKKDVGSAVPDRIPINRKPSASDMAMVQMLNPVQVYEANDSRIDAAPESDFELQPFNVQAKGQHTVYRRVIAGFDNPLDCWLRGSRNEWVLEVRVGSPQDVKSAVEECLKLGAVSAALVAIVAVMVTGGATLAAAIEAFITSIQACLATKLSNILSVTVHHRHYCK